jgi:hypothetical protein
VIALPPPSGAVKGIETVVLFVRVAVPAVGVAATVVAVIALDEVVFAVCDDPLPPTAFTVNVYSVPD